jgi:GNAT superfamily N-acetyltransferase
MPYEAWLPRLRDDIFATYICRVAILNADVVGFVAVDVEKASLEQIFVAPEHQSMGVGKMLVDDAKRLCPSGLILTTLQQNAKAATFYSRQGFERGAAGTNPVNGLPNVEFVWRPSNHPGPA